MNATGPTPLTADDLPIRVPLIHGETTASYLTRTATANGLALPTLCAALGEGLVLPEDGLMPQREEIILRAEAVAALAALVGREPDQLAHALPGAQPDRLAEELRLERWPRDFSAPPLPACPLCMEPGAWLSAEGHRWRPCGCGRRWMAGDDGGYLVDTGPVPDLGRALARHRELVHRAGAVGDALVADAHQVMLWWWVNGQFAGEAWRAREDALGMVRHRRRAAPVAVYPESVALAELMWTWEERRRRRDASAEKWIEAVAQLGAAGTLSKRERTPLTYWLEQHRREPAAKAPGRTAAERRWNRLPALHQRPRPDEHGRFRAPSCLMWVYGLPLTSTTDVCPRCNGRAPSCRWVPYPGCTGRPKR